MLMTLMLKACEDAVVETAPGMLWKLLLEDVALLKDLANGLVA